MRTAARRAAVKARDLLRRDLPHRAWRTWSRFRYGPTRPVRLRDGSTVFVRTDDFRGFRIAQLGGTQPEKIAVWRALAQLEPDVAVDVGANYGEFSLAIAGTGVPVIAVEPNPALQDCLRETFRDFPDVDVVWAAATDAPGTVQLFANPSSSGSAALAAGSPEQERTSHRRGGAVVPTDVPGVRLTDLVDSSTRGLILKIDVEGFELSVLAGAQELLDHVDWWRALVEFGPGPITAAGGDPDAVWAELRRHRGVIVSAASRGVEVPKDAAARACRLGPDDLLPEAAPGEVDVVIGRGVTGAARR